jgi:hypothetical protein
MHGEGCRKSYRSLFNQSATSSRTIAKHAFTMSRHERLTSAHQAPAVPAEEEEVAISTNQGPPISSQQRAVGAQRQRLTLL